MSDIKDRNTVVPANEDADATARLYALLTEERESGQDLLVAVSGPHDSSNFAVMPAGMADLFVEMVTALHAGQPITFVPENTALTTQEAADMLGASRPTVIKMIDAGELSCERVGTHRRIPFSEVRGILDHRRLRVQEMLIASSSDEDLGTPEEIRAALRQARRAVAKQRRGD